MVVCHDQRQKYQLYHLPLSFHHHSCCLQQHLLGHDHWSRVVQQHSPMPPCLMMSHPHAWTRMDESFLVVCFLKRRSHSLNTFQYWVAIRQNRSQIAFVVLPRAHTTLDTFASSACSFFNFEITDGWGAESSHTSSPLSSKHDCNLLTTLVRFASLVAVSSLVADPVPPPPESPLLDGAVSPAGCERKA